MTPDGIAEKDRLGLEKQQIRHIIAALDFHVFTADKVNYSPHDMLRSGYKLKGVINEVVYWADVFCHEDGAYSLITIYVQKCLNPFLVSWHPTLFDTTTFDLGAFGGTCQGIECKDDGVLRLFDNELNTVRGWTAELLKDLKGLLKNETD